MLGARGGKRAGVTARVVAIAQARTRQSSGSSGRGPSCMRVGRNGRRPRRITERPSKGNRPAWSSGIRRRPVLALADDAAAYRQHCRQMLAAAGRGRRYGDVPADAGSRALMPGGVDPETLPLRRLESRLEERSGWTHRADGLHWDWRLADGATPTGQRTASAALAERIIRSRRRSSSLAFVTLAAGAVRSAADVARPIRFARGAIPREWRGGRTEWRARFRPARVQP